MVCSQVTWHSPTFSLDNFDVRRHCIALLASLQKMICKFNAGVPWSAFCFRLVEKCQNKPCLVHSASGLAKIVTKKDGKAGLVNISKVVCDEKPLACKFCRERSGNVDALSTHIKCKHSVVISQPGQESSRTVAVNVTNGEELEGPSIKTFSLESSGK